VKKIKIIHEHLKAAYDRQKQWADLDRRLLEFEVGDKVFLKISPMRGVIRFGSRGKLSPRFIGPFKILERVGEMAYRLTLPHLWIVCMTSFMFLSWGSTFETIVIFWIILSWSLDWIFPTVSDMAILGWTTKVLKSQTILLVLVTWGRRSSGEATWEREDVVVITIPHLFPWWVGKFFFPPKFKFQGRNFY